MAGSSTQVISEADDAHAGIVAQLEQCAVAGDDRICIPFNRAFEDTVIRFVFHGAQLLPRRDEQAQLRQKYGDMRKCLAITPELAAQNAEQLIENCPGEDQLVFPLNDALKRGLTPPPEPKPIRKCWCRKLPSLPQVALEILFGEDAFITRFLAPVRLDATKLLQPPLDMRLAQRVLDYRTERLAFGKRQRFGLACEIGGKGNRFLNGSGHDTAQVTV